MAGWRRGPYAHHADTANAPLYIGGMFVHRPVAHACLDEVAIWDRALDDATIAKVCQLARRQAAVECERGDEVGGKPAATCDSRHPSTIRSG